MTENSRGTAKRRGPGRPFPKGVSGNPGGRPKVIAEVRELAREQTSRAIAALVGVMEQGQSEAARVSAAQILLDRAWGKSSQTLEHHVRREQLDLSKLTDEELAVMERIYERALVEAPPGAGA